MNLLAILLPPRPRGEASPHPPPPSTWAWTTVDAGGAPVERGESPAALLPRTDRVVLVVDAADIGWHRLSLPRVPASRLLAALEGLLEDELLDEPAHTHFALAPGAAPGQAAWIAVTHRPWLAAPLAALGAAGIEVDRIVPAWTPSEALSGHVGLPSAAVTAQGGGDAGNDADQATAARLTVAGPQGVTTWPLAGEAVRRVVDTLRDRPVHWSASPAAVALAERWLGTPVDVLDAASVAARAAVGAWDLRQFELAAARRGTRRLRQLRDAVRGPAWRPVHLGLAALVVVHLVGLNAWAWQQERRIAQLREAQAALLRATHPQVRAVLDAPIQMRRETERLRIATGQPGETDLEAALSAAASAWPDGRPAARALRFESGSLRLTVDGWTSAHAAAFGQALRASGWEASLRGDLLTLQHPATRAGTGAR